MVLRYQRHFFQGLEETVDSRLGELTVSGNVGNGVDVIRQANQYVYSAVNGTDGGGFPVAV